ncbi:hypothetical protein IJH06_01420 [Candidatus Saccharibacteria bacterium]|nr:hypothetical protein [Candidatus Saccharibacteria bacterium]
MNAFTLMPMEQMIELNAGEIYRGSITVANPADSTEDFYYAVGIVPYSVSGSEYEVNLAKKSNRSLMVDWISIKEPTGVIHPNEVKTIEFTINVPETAPAGGQYAALAVRSDAPSDRLSGTNVQNIYEMVSVIFADVAGETVHDGQIVSNMITGFVANGKASVGAELVNNGNTHEVAEVTVEAKNAITGDVILSNETTMNTYQEVIMPETSRYITREVDGMAGLGIYEVSQSISYMGAVSTNTTTVIVCPLWFMMLFILTIGTIIGTILALIVKRRRAKKIV